MFLAALERQGARVRAQRDEAPVGDVSGAVAVLFDHYEEFGDHVLKLLADEERTPALRAVTDPGRAMHAEWVGARLRPHAHAAARRRARAPPRPARRLCDVYTWSSCAASADCPGARPELAVIELLRPLTEDH